jgi:uncharacterized protein DUF3164
MSKIDIKDLTEDQRQELLAELKKEQDAKNDKKRQDRQDYEGLKDMAIGESFLLLKGASQGLQDVKKVIFDNFDDVLNLKKVIFELTSEQMELQESHTFTSSDGKASIIIGSNTVDRWDESVDVGVLKVKEYLKGLAVDEKTGILVDYITDLLKPNKDGVLKSSRVLDLSKKANEIGDEKLIEAVNLIRDAYRPSKTSTYVKAKFKDEKSGKFLFLPLSMSALP